MKKKKRQEKFILFTSKVQLNKFKECSQIFMDGTFKSCPKSFYQLYNIIGKDKNTGLIIPLIFVLMSHKSYDMYYFVFKFMKNILEKEKIDFCVQNTYFMLGFEISNKKALNIIYLVSKILLRYFYYVKALFTKSKKKV